MGNIQNGATLTRRDELLKKSCYFYFLCVFSSLHKIQIEPLMADGLPWRCFSFFSEPRQCYLLGSQWDRHKPPGFYLKYLKLCSKKDEKSFYGVGTTCGQVNNDNIFILGWSNPSIMSIHSQVCLHAFFFTWLLWSEGRGEPVLKVPYCTPFWSFILGFDVLKNIYLQYKYQNPYIFTALFSEALFETVWFCPV